MNIDRATDGENKVLAMSVPAKDCSAGRLKTLLAELAEVLRARHSDSTHVTLEHDVVANESGLGCDVVLEVAAWFYVPGIDELDGEEEAYDECK